MSEHPPTDVGVLIRHARGLKSPPWTQSDLARESGVSREHINAIECGRTPDPGIGYTRQLFTALGLSMALLDAEPSVPHEAPSTPGNSTSETPSTTVISHPIDGCARAADGRPLPAGVRSGSAVEV